MSDIALRVEGLGKRYRLGLKDSATGGMYRYKSLRDSFGSLAKHPVQALRSAVARQPMDETNSFWALSDVNFEVKRGEVVGIIGRNGAGKSTLLKILSRITKPTTGHVALYGRVGSLLEVGTGFHPELSGRENIYLNGAILGMTRVEVKGKFDEIVAFSEVEKFLDTPVKQYSSGMYMRLAFAVAAHLEPEILVVDEVLAVGDAAFQNKCLGKMKEVAEYGKTVLFVSHQMNAISRLCGKCVLLSAGRVAAQGTTGDVTAMYLTSGLQLKQRVWDKNRPSVESVTVRGVSITAADGAQLIFPWSDIRVNIDFDSKPRGSRVRVGLLLQDLNGVIVTGSASPELNTFTDDGSKASVAAVIQSPNLAPGRYGLALALSLPPHTNPALILEDCLAFDVEVSEQSSTDMGPRPGMIVPIIEWLCDDDDPKT
jgi:lipopolysaccharide transport system ATP-binding protein